MLLSLVLLGACVAAAEPGAGAPGGGAPLYQLLYAGEYGDDAYAAGQALRARLWLRALSPDADQRAALQELIALAARLQQAQDAERAALGEREERLLVPLYAELADALAAPGDPDAAQMADLEDRIRAARAEVTAGADPAANDFRRVTRLFEAARRVVQAFPEDQWVHLGAARLLLERSVSPLRTPGADAAQLGGTWEAMDFAALKVDPRESSTDPLDIGGLWATEKIGQAGNTDLVEAQLAAILMVVAGEPALAEVLDVPVPAEAAAIPAGVQ